MSQSRFSSNGQLRHMITELEEWLRIPSVSTDPSHDEDCAAAARWIKSQLEALGCTDASLLGSETHPVIVAHGPSAPGRPTVLVYGHYDVQPPDPVDRWMSAPFEPTERDGSLYARGATDDKGQLFAIVKAFEVLSRIRKPEVNLRFVIEGQEESGSRVLFEVLGQRGDLLQADAVLVADGPYYAPGVPTVEIGIRGLLYVELRVRTLKSDLHSGLYGGVAPNAHEALARILAQLKSPWGSIQIPGLYEGVRRPSCRELEQWSELPFDQSEFLSQELGARALAGHNSYTVHERLWALPTLDIHGIGGGFTGSGVKTVIPSEATAKLSLRLVPDQCPETVFAQLDQAVRALAPSHADVGLELLAAADPILIDREHVAFSHIDRAFREVEGRGVVFTRSGGSLPILSMLGREGAPVVLAGIGLPDDNPHAPNEKISLNQFAKGVTVFKSFFERMGSTT